MLEKNIVLLSLPHNREEKQWLKERLETPPAKDPIALAAAVQKVPQRGGITLE